MKTNPSLLDESGATPPAYINRAFRIHNCELALVSRQEGARVQRLRVAPSCAFARERLPKAQAGGLIFRLKDANKYCVVQANALENNFNLYKVVDGRRREITGSSVTVPSGQWHELRVQATGDRITCYFDGEKKMEASDSTFRSPGKVGLWTKADSVSSFDDLTITAKLLN